MGWGGENDGQLWKIVENSTKWVKMAGFGCLAKHAKAESMAKGQGVTGQNTKYPDER
jgi:hypothetical protein